MKKVPEQVLAFVGASNTGKSFVARYLSQWNNTGLNADSVDQVVGDETKYSLEAQDLKLKRSERPEYYFVDSDEKSLELVVAPGHRKYWKGLDFVISESDSAMIFVSSNLDGSLPISSLIEPLVHLIAFDVHFCGIVLNITNLTTDMHNLLLNEVRSDLIRVLGQSVADSIPVFSFSHSDLEASIALIREFILTEIPVPVRQYAHAFTLSITRVHGKDACAAFVEGKVLTGSVSVGDTVKLMPANIPLQVESICTNDMQTPTSASAGRLVGLRLGQIDSKFLSTGMVLTNELVQLGKSTRCISVRIDVFNTCFPIKVGFSPMISIMGCHVHGQVSQISEGKEFLSLGDTGVVELTLNKAVYAELFRPEGRLGRVTLRQENVIVAVGVIVSL